MTIVRIVLADPRSGRPPAGSVVNGQRLIVLADDAGHRAVPLWLGLSLSRLSRNAQARLRRSVTGYVFEDFNLLHDACKRNEAAAAVGGMTAVVVTRDAQLASWAGRVVFLRDGQDAPAPGSLFTSEPNR